MQTCPKGARKALRLDDKNLLKIVFETVRIAPIFWGYYHVLRPPSSGEFITLSKPSGHAESVGVLGSVAQSKGARQPLF